MRRTVIGVVALTAAATALSGVGMATAAETGSGSDARLVVKASGLDIPFGLAKRGKHSFVVAENAAGKVTQIGPKGGQSTVVSGAPGVSGVASRGRFVFSVIGGPNEQGAPPAGTYKPTQVLRTNMRNGRTKVLANLERYELNHNPDGQKQFVNGQPVDALSNPFSAAITPRGLLVADGGANDVLRINPDTGKVTTFFVPPTVKPRQVAACGQSRNNPGTVGCDSVPTGVAFANGSVWVSTLGAEVPGAGRIYKLNPRNGKVRRVYPGLNSPTGVAVTSNGAIWFSQVLKSNPAGPPGQIVRIGPRGKVTRAKVFQPVGLAVRRGKLFSTAGSLAGPGAGQIVRVTPNEFR